MIIIRFVRWCRALVMGPPAKQRRQEHNVLAWRVPRSMLQDTRRI